MSTNILYVIPRDPNYIPAAGSYREAESLLRRFVGAAEGVFAEVETEVEFFHPGEFLERISCPFCGKDLQEWWHDAMNTAFRTHFGDLSTTVPCCQRKTSLNAIHYNRDAGFARFSIKAEYPRQPTLDAIELAQLEELLGCSLKQVFCHM